MQLKFVVLVVVFFFEILPANTSKILAIVPTPAFSHQSCFRPIWKELLQRGHEVTLITANPMRDPKLVNLTEISVEDSYKDMEKLYAKMAKSSKLIVLLEMFKTIDIVFDKQLSKEAIKALISNETVFDVVICESVFFEYLALADLYKVPKIMVSSLDTSVFIHGFLGNTMNPVSNPDYMLPSVPGYMNFKERLSSFLYQFIYFNFKWFSNWVKKHEIMKKHFGENVRSPYEILSDIDLTLINTSPVTYHIQNLGPNVIQIGGGVHIVPENPLPKDLNDFLESATEGCIYFSLGTNSKSAYMGQEKIKIVLEALSELPYKVIWKFEIEDMINPPKNVKLIAWAPQQDILRHPNVKLFITQGGIQSLEEGIINQVPMAMMPMFGDQPANAKRMEIRGLARIIPHQPLPDKEEFKSIVMDVINNPLYKQNVKKAAEILLDQPMKAVDKAVWWIEYVLRHKGAKHLRNPVVDIPLYQYYCLDIIAVIVAFIFTIFKILQWILRKLNSLFQRKTVKKTNKLKNTKLVFREILI